jgi:hypothetical protein
MSQYRYGVYFKPLNNKRNSFGVFAIASPATENNLDWKIDKDMWKPHPILRMKMRVVQTGTGEYFFNKALQGFEYVGEL